MCKLLEGLITITYNLRPPSLAYSRTAVPANKTIIDNGTNNNMAYARSLKWVLLTILVMTTFFLASFNATLRYIVDQRRDLLEEEQKAEVGASNFGNNDKGEIIQVVGSGSGDEKKGGKGGSSSSTAAYKNKQPTEQEEEEDEADVLHAERLQSEQENPTFDKFRTTIRPISNMELPSVTSYSRQSHVHSTPNSGGGGSSTLQDDSVAFTADTHYAKFIRMTSSNFDQLSNGGNALPYPVHSSEYDQEIYGKNGRGDGFVKVDSKLKRYNKKKRRRRSKRQRHINNNGNGGGKKAKRKIKEESDISDEKKSIYENNYHDNEETPYDMIIDYIYECYYDMMDYLYEVMGVEFDDDNEQNHHSSSNNAESLGPSSSSSPSETGNVETENSASKISGEEGYISYDDEDQFSWSDTRVGSQLLWLYSKLMSLWSRQHATASKSLKKEVLSKKSSTSSSSTSTSSLSKQDILAREGLFHLEKAAELGHAEAQRVVANSLASGILPISDHSLMHRLAKYQYIKNQSPDDDDDNSSTNNWTSILLQSTLQVPDDFSSGGGQQLSRAVLLWHLSAMDGNVESAMALGYRHLYSATGGTTRFSDLNDDSMISTGYHPVSGGQMGGSGAASSGSTNHYGVLGTCPTAMAYYEAAANGVLDELENGPTKGKVNPPLDEHRLAEIFMHGGASVSLEASNKPDELEEALQYYRMLASRSRNPEPDLVAAFTIANFYYNGYRGVKQDLRLALQYYEICGDYNHWEGGGLAGLMHVWGIGMTPDERDLGKAYFYFDQGTPGGLDTCFERMRMKKKNNKNSDVILCDKNSINGMGYIHLLGVEGLADRDVNIARRWFELGKDMGDAESSYSYAMLRLGWMVNELEDLSNKVHPTTDSSSSTASAKKRKTVYNQNYVTHRQAPLDTTPVDKYTGPSASDYSVAVQQLQLAANKGHLQAKHKLGMLYASGANIPKKHHGSSQAVKQSCTNALRYYKWVADSGHTISRRNRAAWKQYNAGDYESSLRNYLASAEIGSVIGQVNSAFLLEQGYCLGMTTEACTHASVRLWRAAARQGNLEACLRVGDFYYYGRMKKSRSGLRKAPPSKEEGGETAALYDREAYLSSLEAKAFYFIPGPYRWSRYILYPEELFDSMCKWVSQSVKNLLKYASSTEDETIDVPTSQDDTCTDDDGKGTCAPEWTKESEEDKSEEEFQHMAIAAQYYRKAAEEHKSARANFNLAFMFEWGMGLTQDFPLAKRHYDLSKQNNSNMAAVIALYAMRLHQKIVKLRMYILF